MRTMMEPISTAEAPIDPSEMVDRVAFHFSFSRRGFVQVLGAGLVITMGPLAAHAQSRRRGRGGRGPEKVSARLHIGEDGTVTVLTGKIEAGQGARAELSQAAAEELRIPVERVKLVMGDTGMVPDDGLTAGSRTTPSTVPAVRQGAAAAREFLVRLSAKRWNVEPTSLEVREGTIRHPPSGRSATYAALAVDSDAAEALEQQIPEGLEVTAVKAWKVLGHSLPRPNARDIVVGAHAYPTDQIRPGMLYGKVLRAPSYGARLTDVDLEPPRAMKGVVVVRDGEFVGVAAPTQFAAEKAVEALEKTARWEPAAHPSSAEVYDYLRERAAGGVPVNPFGEETSSAHHVVRGTYHAAYVQHAPMEPRTALAEWAGDKLTVWTGTQNPFGYASEMARAFRMPVERVQVIVPDFGGGFGGKHSGEAAIEAARIAKGAGKPVHLRWSRGEEFIWAYFRPAAVIDAEATLDTNGQLTSWYFVNINSGGSAVETPYRIEKTHCRYVGSQAPLRQGSYRGLAATANNFARESLMDELSDKAGLDPLAFRLAHLENPRLRAVLQEAARRFGWDERRRQKKPGVGVGLACGTEKGSYVAACAEVVVDPDAGSIAVRHVTEAFECGAILNPDNLANQVRGAVVMGLGPALREEMKFDQGRMRNPSFGGYLVPRFADVPTLDVHLLDRPDLPSVGAGETPLIAIAPAIANGVFHAAGRRIRQMPIRWATA